MSERVFCESRWNALIVIYKWFDYKYRLLYVFPFFCGFLFKCLLLLLFIIFCPTLLSDCGLVSSFFYWNFTHVLAFDFWCCFSLIFILFRMNARAPCRPPCAHTFASLALYIYVAWAQQIHSLMLNCSVSVCPLWMLWMTKLGMAHNKMKCVLWLSDIKHIKTQVVD